MKTSSYRTKRRKIQQEMEVLESLLDVNSSNCLEPQFFNVSPIQESIIENENHVNNCASNNLNSSEKPTSEDVINNALGYKVLSSNTPLNYTIPNEVINSNTVLYDNEDDVKKYLGEWAVDCNVPQSTVNRLLCILKCKAQLEYLPKDCRTLLKSTSTKFLNIREVKPGIYYHFGIKKGIQRYSSMLTTNEQIKIAIGIDGLPISKSSSGQLWPILAYIIPHRKYVFPVGIYYGKEKPQDSNDFLSDYITEIIDLSMNGININNEIKMVTIELMCCDAPAKSFVLRVKGHSGFFSCTRCIHEGEYLNNRVCFPYKKNGSMKRLHQDHVQMRYEEHHTSSTISCIALIPNADIVNLFPLDYMHLVCLGVTKKLISLWLNTGPTNVRLPSWKIKNITTSLNNIKKCTTNDFARKPRAIEEFKRYKATEFRQFLLYTGPIVLKNILSDDCYQHFMTFSVTLRILLNSNQNSKYLRYAKKLLEFFVERFQQIYGCQFISHNIHGLLHLVDDYYLHGSLDNCSAFTFENYMKELKGMLRKHETPLQQIVRRYEERCNNESIQVIDPLQFTFTINEPDCFFLSKSDDIIHITKLSSKTDTIVGQKFEKKMDFFSNPICFSKLNIYKIKNLSENNLLFKTFDIKNKMVVFKIENELIAMPLLR